MRIDEVNSVVWLFPMSCQMLLVFWLTWKMMASNCTSKLNWTSDMASSNVAVTLSGKNHKIFWHVWNIFFSSWLRNIRGTRDWFIWYTFCMVFHARWIFLTTSLGDELSTFSRILYTSRHVIHVNTLRKVEDHENHVIWIISQLFSAWGTVASMRELWMTIRFVIGAADTDTWLTDP